MPSFSYSVSPQLKTNLYRLDELRIKILTTPLPPKAELRLRWESTVDRVHYSLAFSGSSMKRKDIVGLLAASSHLRKPKDLTTDEKFALKYKKALDIISQNWIMSDKTISPKTVVALHEIGAIGSLKKRESEIKQILDYVQTGGDHPVVQAAIIYAAIESLHPFSDGNGRISRLLSLLFLYKAGFDFRGLICLEKEWYANQEEFKNALNQGMNNAHMTNWIEYFSKSLLSQLETKLEDINAAKSGTVHEKRFFNLNERQKEILSLLEEPDSSITNRLVQRHFRISQITASRDLTHLASLDMLIPRGRGRSIYYTKA